jgi:RNA polymerase sigma factor (sigma-70 family)
LQLARRAASGEIAAYEELVGRYEPRLRSLLRRLAGEIADDLAQETFLAAWRAAGTWRGESAYFTWLTRIAWRQFLSHQRRTPHGATPSEMPDVIVDPQAERRAAIDQAMSLLPEKERMAALLCFAEGHSHNEAALVMSVPLGTLKTLLARARRQLMECLESDQ